LSGDSPAHAPVCNGGGEGCVRHVAAEVSFFRFPRLPSGLPAPSRNPPFGMEMCSVLISRLILNRQTAFWISPRLRDVRAADAIRRYEPQLRSHRSSAAPVRAPLVSGIQLTLLFTPRAAKRSRTMSAGPVIRLRKVEKERPRRAQGPRPTCAFPSSARFFFSMPHFAPNASARIRVAG
jgi:hypothetical protein